MTLFVEFGPALNFRRAIDYGLLFDEVAVDRLFPHLRIFPRKWR